MSRLASTGRSPVLEHAFYLINLDVGNLHKLVRKIFGIRE